MSLEQEVKLHLLAQHLGENKLGEDSILRIIWEAHSKRQETHRAILCLLEGYPKELVHEVDSDPVTETIILYYDKIKNDVNLKFKLVYDSNNLGDCKLDTLIPLSSELTISKVYARPMLDALIKEHFQAKDR